MTDQNSQEAVITTPGVGGMVERVADAIDSVRLFSRFNDWTSDHVPGQPIEICRHGRDDEEEIVIVARYPAHYGESQALFDEVSTARARAAIEAMRPVLEAAKAEIEWWVDEHGCCAGHEAETIAMIDAALNEKPAAS